MNMLIIQRHLHTEYGVLCLTQYGAIYRTTTYLARSFFFSPASLTYPSGTFVDAFVLVEKKKGRIKYGVGGDSETIVTVETIKGNEKERKTTTRKKKQKNEPPKENKQKEEKREKEKKKVTTTLSTSQAISITQDPPGR